MQKNPLVSVAMITYNQEKYIKQAIDSVLEQQVNFDYEIIIGDDNSTDSTSDILKEYTKKHKNIKVINRKKNIGAIPNFMQTFRQARGKYIALCEGDDFWTDPTKLQRQVDFLEENKDYALVFHPVKVIFENGEEEDSIFPDYKIGFSEEGLLRGNFIQTNSVMYRARKLEEYTALPECIIPGDWYLHLFHARFGKIGFIDRIMATYRRHSGGIWWGEDGLHDKVFWEENAEGHIALFIKLYELYEKSTTSRYTLLRNVLMIISATDTIDFKKRTILLKNIFNKYPEATVELLDMYSNSVTAWDAVQKEKNELIVSVAELDDTVNRYKKIIEDIHSSRVWRLRNKVSKLIGRGEV